ERVGDPEVRVLPLPDDEEQLVRARVAVEVVAVVEVAIAGGRLPDRHRHLVDREVVSGREHGRLPGYARSSSMRRSCWLAVWSKAVSAAPGNTPEASSSFITRVRMAAQRAPASSSYQSRCSAERPLAASHRAIDAARSGIPGWRGMS